jgi:conjugal transfer pilus assembly protein TraB
MKEKFGASKLKQNAIALTALVGSLVVIFIGSTLLSGESQKEKEKKIAEMPKIKYIDSDKMEKDSFKGEYGKQLTSVQQKQTEVDRKLQELAKKLEESEREKRLMMEENRKNQNQNTPVTNAFIESIEIPPIPNSDFNSDESKEDIVEVSVSQDLLVIDNKNTNENNDSNIDKLTKDEEAKKNSKPILLPAGSFVKAVLINGFDAPAGANSKSEPHPVVLRLIADANLPNSFKSDIKECRATGGGYGELSSERAIIRIEKVICMANNGDIYEATGKAIGFVTGEDGKIGLSGRVVTKQGAILARSIAAAFIEGVAKVYQDSSQTVNNTGLGSVSTVDPDKATQAGLASGFGEGAKKLSEYYLKLNDQMFSVVEINVGREADVLFNKTVVLKKYENMGEETNENN